MTPAERVAGAYCVLARHRGQATTTHPVRCRFCDVELAELERRVLLVADGEGDFRRLPPSAREKLVTEAAARPLPSWIDEL